MNESPYEPQESAMSINQIFFNRAALGCVLSVSGVMGAYVASADASTSIASEYRSVVQDGMDLMVVVPNSVSLRCGDQDVFYAIGELKANTRVQAAGVSESYTMILMPESIGAFVPANEVDAALDGNTVTLMVDSKLRAPSHLLGMSGSWKGMYAVPLTSGTSLDVIEVMKSDSGDVLGYRVVAPKGPEGELPIAYIRTDALRDATDAEVRAFTNSGNTTPIPTPEVDPSPTLTPEPETDVSDSADDESDSEVDSSLMEPMDTQVHDEPVEISNAAPVEADEESQQATEQDSTQQITTNGRISTAQLEDLEAAFAHARNLPRVELDEALSELLAEFSRTREHAEPGTSLAKALDQRIEWINIRIESRDQRQAIASALAAYDARTDVLSQQIKDWQSGRAYAIVGRMVTSSVYTGERLALLYRIQSMDPKSGRERTIGYVSPREGQDFRHMLGRVVGVVGSTHQDESLNLRVVSPDRIELMPE